MGRENPKISVIICAYTMERLNDIHEAVNSVLAQTLKPYEIIISIDHNEKLFQRLRDELPGKIKIVNNNGVQGVAETRNLGIRAATGDITTLMDDDAVAQSDWLRSLVEPIRSRHAAVVGGKCNLIWLGGKHPFWFPEELDWIVGGTYKGLPLNGNEIRNVSGCNMACATEVFGQVGFFSSDIGAVKGNRRGGEEAEFCLRVKRAMPDRKILYEPDAVVYHKVPSWRMTLKYVIKRSFDEGFSKAKLETLVSSPNPLSTETSYLCYLLFTSIPQRLKRFYKKGSLSQVGAIIVSIAATGVGYLAGRVKYMMRITDDH